MHKSVAPEAAVQLPARYQLRAILKEAASTGVYRVFDAADRREKALKILRQELRDPQQLARFRAEFATLATLDHRNVVRVFDFGLLADAFPYFTMEFFAGRKISEWFDGQEWDALYDVIMQIASALHHIHQAGIVHLDLKPSNILVDADGRAKLMDFGLAVETHHLFDRTIRGTLEYMAPEVLRQDRVDSRADFYALGMTLYETVTGTLPAYGRDVIDVIRMHLDHDVKPPTAINPNVPSALEQVILKLLEKDPRHRYPSAAALIEDVARAAARPIAPGEGLTGYGELFAAPLIGRKPELAQLNALVAEARQGRGNGVIVAGAEGMGKSRIVRDATLRAQLDGARVFCGRCPTNRKTIYAPFVEIFQQLITAVNPEASVTEELRRILRPVVGSSAPHAAASQHGQKYRLFNRIVQSMQDIYGFLAAGSDTAGSPLILVVEDLQWADPSTAELFAFLVEEARRNKLLVIGILTYEAGGDAGMDVPSASAFWEARAGEAGFPIIRVERLSEPLVREHLQALLGEPNVPDELVRWILWESAGSPLLIRRMLEHLVAENLLVWHTGAWHADMERIRSWRIPGGAASILMQRVEGLTADQRGVLEAAAVCGEVVPFEVLAAVPGLPQEQAYRIIRQVVDAGLLDESSDGRTISFPQMHLRGAMYNAMSDRRRSELHQRVGEALEPMLRAGSAQLVGEVAYHFARAGDVERGTRYSIDAGDAAARTLAHEQAADFYRTALELMDLGAVDEARKAEVREKLADAYYRRDDYRSAIHSYQFLLKSIQTRTPDGPSGDIARVMKKIGKVLGRRGDHDAALTYFQNALALYEELGRADDVAEILNRSAWVHRDKGDLEAARGAAERAQEILASSRPSVIHGYVKNTLGAIELSLGNWQRAREILSEAVALGESLGSEQLIKIASTNIGNTLWKLGEWETARRYFRKNLSISEAEGDLWDLITAYNNMGVVEYGRGNFAAAAEYFEKSVTIDEKIGALEYEALAQENLADALEMLGRWPEAMQHYQRCLTLEGFDESRPARISVYVPLSRLMTKRGDLAKALDYAQKALHAAERARDEDLIAEAAQAVALVEAERENYDVAEKHLARALAIFEQQGTVHGLARAHTLAARLALQQQDVVRAATAAARGAELAGRVGDRFTQAVNDWVWGKIHFFRGERDASEAKIDAARSVFEELDTPYELARLLFDVGLLREEPEAATEMIRSAVRIFERLEATHDLERARGALFRIRPAGRGPDQGVVGLYEIVKIINSSLDLQEVLNRVLDVCIRRLRAERGMIMLLDPITGALRTRVARNIREPLDDAARRSPQSLVREVIESGHSLLSADAGADQRFSASQSVVAENILSVLCVPLIIKNTVAGAIYVDHRETRHLFTQKDLSFMEAFADQAAIAIENARLYQELEEARLRLSMENESLRREVLVEKHLDSVVGNSEAVARIQFAIRKAAAGSSTVLLRGESGTGKGLVARIIHNVSPRRNGPFIKFNCAALPETLAESELFGHERGAFTGADRRKLGRFELANGGTIFLDEIGKISLAMQAKLLRVVEDKEFERVGGTQTIKTDVKIITATNLDLERAIGDGTFREDLYYRLNIVPLVLPPLRERKDDVAVLAEHFIRKICRDLGVETKRLDHGVIDMLLRYEWPGNVRELEATLHRAIVMSNGDVISRADLPALSGGFRPPAESSSPASRTATLLGEREITGDVYDEILSSVDRQLIVRALEDSGGRIREAARRLGLARNTLKAKMQKYGIAARE